MLNPIDLKRIKDSGAPKDVTEVYEYLKRYRDNEERQKWFEERYEKPWKAAFENELWTEEEKEQMTAKDQVPLVVNDMAKGIQGSAAIVTASKPGININPIGISDLYVSELILRGVTYVWDQVKGQRRLFKLVKHCKTGTIGCLEIKYDKSKGQYGRVVVKNFKPDILFWDKDSEEDDYSDSHLIKARLVTKTYALEEYPDLKEKDLSFQLADPASPSKSSGITGGDNYAEESSKADPTDKTLEEPKDIWEIEAWLLKKVNKWCVSVVDTNNPASLDKKLCAEEDEAKMMVVQLALSNPDIICKITKEKVEVRIHRIIVGAKKIEEEENAYGLDSNHEPVLNVIVLSHDETLNGYPTGPSVRALELSKERNKRRMQSIYVVTKNLDAPIVTGEGYKIVKDPKFGDIMQVAKDMAFPPQRLLPGTTPQEAFALEKVAQDDLKNEYDVQDAMVGKLPAGQISGRAVMALQDMGSMMSKPFIESVEDCAVRMAKVFIAIITKHWPREMWMRLIEPEEMTSWQPDKEKQVDDKGKEIEPDPEEVKSKWENAIDQIMNQKVSLINLDVKVSAGSTLPTNRMAKREDAIEMVKAGIYDPEAALDYVDDPYKDQVKDRIKTKAEQSGAPEKINYSVSISVKDLPGEAQSQILGNIGIKMNPDNAIPPEQGAMGGV